MRKLYYLDKLGWPVETVKGRWFQNFLRRLIHTKRITFKKPFCLLTGQERINVNLVTAGMWPLDWKVGATIDLQKSHGINLAEVVQDNMVRVSEGEACS